MANKRSSELPANKLEVRQIPGGADYVELDAQSSEFYHCRYHLSKCSLISETATRLPIVGYFLPPGSGIPRGEPNTPNATEPAKQPLGYFHFLPAIQLAVVGDIDGDDYREGSKIEFSAGILFAPSLNSWRSCREIHELWTPEVWEQSGFDYRIFQKPNRIPSLPMETLSVKGAVLANIAEKQLRLLCDGLQIEAKGTTRLERSVVERMRIATSGEIAEAINVAAIRKFSEFCNVTARIPDRLKRLLAINFLYNYWDRHSLPYAHRVFHILRLGVKSAYGITALWNDCQEAGCAPRTRSLALRQYEHIRSQAKMYYKRHPAERERLERTLFDEQLIQDHGSSRSLYSKLFHLPPPGRRGVR